MQTEPSTATIATASPRPGGRLHFALLLAILLLAAGLRLVALDRIPPAINQDEAVHAYDAWCFRTNGTDHYQNRWPIFFRCFGVAEHHSAPFIWALVPLQSIFGMNVWTTRLPGAILGTLNVWWVYLLLRRFYGSRAGLLAAMMLAISPWHVHLSRLAFEVSICPPLVTLGILLLAGLPDAQSSRKALLRAAAAGLVLGITLWTYNAMRVFLPLLLLGGAVLYRDAIFRLVSRPRGGRTILTGIFCFGIGMAPFIWATLMTPEKAWGRASTQSVFTAGRGFNEIADSVCQTYLMHLSPRYLFVQGDPSLVQGLPHYGQLNAFMTLLLPVGLWRVWTRRDERFGRFIVYWILVSAVPPALTVLDAGHALRSAGALPAYQMLAAIGLDLLLSRVQQTRRLLYVPVTAAACIIILLNGGYFGYRFFRQYPTLAAGACHSEWPEVFREIESRKAGYDAVLLTHLRTNQLGMLYLFWQKVPPQDFFRMDKRIIETNDLDIIVQLGSIYFAPTAVMNESPLRGRHLLVGERPGVDIPGREVKRFFYPDGQVALILYDVPGIR